MLFRPGNMFCTEKVWLPKGQASRKPCFRSGAGLYTVYERRCNQYDENYQECFCKPAGDCKYAVSYSYVAPTT